MKKDFRFKTLLATFASAAAALLISATPMKAQPVVKNIVLVHGAFADGSGWKDVYEELVKDGYSVSVVGNPNTGLEEDVAATKRVLDRQNGPVILVGHSYGGIVISEAGNDPSVAGLVYIDAFVPESNESAVELLKKLPEARNSGVLPPDKDGYVWYDKAKFHSGFCNELSDDKAGFMANSQVPVNGSVFTATISNPAWKVKPSWYVVGTEDQTIPADGQRFMAKRAGAITTEVVASHVSYITKAKHVVKVIESASKDAYKVTVQK
ncbi:alpha/beta fold hydrolase [Polluticoccus soli]|uniref:alpha/beta fold hydrolase n=1 Tax=Polluticoccus soli TaxID=3034150 RepID=UPI0023E1E51B|nr:alpha/beta hydrolase [Flavipsychrobacter sp. JY13-12]